MRIISLCPSLTELVCDLGQARELIACTKYCIHPERRTRRLLKVGGTKDPKLDDIIALKVGDLVEFISQCIPSAPTE